MQEIFDLIEQRRHRYEQHAFIQMLRDDRIPAPQRLGYAPYASHFVLTFAEINRTYLHDDDVSSRQQQLVNRHAREDSTHFAWFLHDLGLLGFDIECRFSDALRFLWSDLGRHTRDLGYYLISEARDADATFRLVLVEALEAMGNAWLEATLVAARAHPHYERLIYFGQHHMDRETGHAIGSDVEEIRAIVLPSADRERAVRVVHGLFDRMEAFNAELLRRMEDARGPEPLAFSGRPTHSSREAELQAP